MGVAGWRDGVNSYYSGGSVSIGGNAMSVGRADDTNYAYDMTVLWYRVNPPTRTQSLAWDWSGTNAPSDNSLIFYSFYNGVDTSNPIRSSGGQATATSSASAGTLTSTSGDYAVGVSYGWANTLPTNITWTGPTELFDITTSGSLGTNRESYAHSATTGNMTVSTSQNGSGTPYSTISAIILRQSTETPSTAPFNPRRVIIAL